ncbi:heparanase-like protein 3 isoform X3 [Selaginella moellendorffii]|uniref:heparanase-like protein 3 isoform X3 n=1 Tax=Selaginella moellendorffii TaxID=88036 RepID=UPI000D1CE145|nr:heparanase-like protein 3 isoform X3 [Selaginella moellendorffii]|eukprot:XP_024541545.1 heparanase-like protein 3 isoform X3 [Selaginella moellendorffii]
MNTCLASCGTLTLLLIVLAVLGSLLPRHHRRDHSLWIALPATLALDASIPVATVDEHFVCATIDWWPQGKCNYGSCSWFHSSILNLDLTNRLLAEAVTALAPLLIRLGGSLEDQIFYDVGSSATTTTCKTFTTQNHRFGFSTGCLNMSRWQQLNEFFQRTGSLVAFGLNALHGKERIDNTFQGPWNSSNARDFIAYTASKGYPIKAWGLGNELSSSFSGVTLDSRNYAADVDELQQTIDEIYGTGQKPVLVAPDGFFDAYWYSQVLQQTRTDPALRAVSLHVYDLGPGDGKNIAARILNAAHADRYQQVQRVLRQYGNGAKAWVGEAGGIYNGGQHLVSDAFVFSFWYDKFFLCFFFPGYFFFNSRYLDQLGMAALHNTAVFCRQSLIGGNYGLLDSNFNPNPDFYSALLWKRLMGEVVLNVTSQSLNSSSFHTYAHCLKNARGGIAVLVINFSNNTQVVLDLGLESQKLEYHLSSPDGNVQSQRVALNGQVLEGAKSELKAIAVEGSNPSKVAPLSIAFITLPDAFVPACTL